MLRLNKIHQNLKNTYSSKLEISEEEKLLETHILSNEHQLFTQYELK